MSEMLEKPEWKLDILNASFLCGTPILAVIGAYWYTVNFGISFIEIGILFLMYIASGLSITAGYHRLFSHRSHSASWPLRLFYAVFGAAAFQNSAIKLRNYQFTTFRTFHSWNKYSNSKTTFLTN